MSYNKLYNTSYGNNPNNNFASYNKLHNINFNDTYNNAYNDYLNLEKSLIYHLRTINGHKAFDNNKYEIIKKILTNKNIDINSLSEYDSYISVVYCRLTPLMACAKNTKIEENIINSILDHPNLDICVKNISGYNALHYAIESKNIRFLSTLFKNKNIDQYLISNIINTNCLIHYAIQIESYKTIEILLKIQGVDVNTLDRNGVTPLMISIFLYNSDVFSMLLEHPEIDINIKHKEHGVSVLHIIQNDKYHKKFQLPNDFIVSAKLSIKKYIDDKINPISSILIYKFKDKLPPEMIQYIIKILYKMYFY